jgi:hypothetical protein
MFNIRDVSGISSILPSLCLVIHFNYTNIYFFLFTFVVLATNIEAHDY